MRLTISKVKLNISVNIWSIYFIILSFPDTIFLIFNTLCITINTIKRMATYDDTVLESTLANYTAVYNLL